MTSVKFCRFSSECGPESRCRNNLFGLKRSKCVSTKGSCRFDSSCPKYYQCVGNTGGLTKGKCLLAISQSNPLSKSVNNVSKAILDPAAVYRKTKQVNIVPLIIITVILGGIGYFVYQVFIKPYPKSAPGSCFTSADCIAEDGKGDVSVEFQCGSKLYNTKKPPDIVGVKSGVCDCNVLQGGGQQSIGEMGYSKPDIEIGGNAMYYCDCKNIMGSPGQTGCDDRIKKPYLDPDFNCRTCKCWCPNDNEWKVAPLVMRSRP